MYSFINYKCVKSKNNSHDIINIIHNLLDNIIKYIKNSKKKHLTKSLLIESNPKFFKLLKNIENYKVNNKQKGGKVDHHPQHQKPPDFYCGDVKPYAGFCDNHYSQCCSTGSCNTSLGGKKSKKKSLIGGKVDHPPQHQKPPDFYCGDVKPYAGFCDNHYSQCCSTGSCNTSLGGKKSKKKSLIGGKVDHPPQHQKPPDFYCGDVKPYAGFCDNHYSQCCSTGSCNTALGGKRSKKKKIMEGGNLICGDVQAYSGFCDNHASQCCTLQNSNSCTKTGGKKKRNKFQKGGGDLQCGDVSIYSGFCDNASSQCCGNIGGNNGSSSGACLGQSGGKRKQKGSSYNGMLSQLYSSRAYTPSIYEIERFNKKVAEGLDIPCIEGGINMKGGGGAQIQLSAGSPTPITPTDLFDYTYKIMDKMSSHDPPLEWATHFSNGNEAADIIELNNDIYANKIQKGLPTNYQLGGNKNCKVINKEKFKQYILEYIKNKYKKITITTECIELLASIVIMWYVLIDNDNNYE